MIHVRFYAMHTMTTQTIVILGAGFTGLPLALKLLAYTAPKTPLKVIIVSPSSSFYWNLAATRGIIPGAIPDSQLFLPIEPGLARYPKHQWNFVLGKATSIDPDRNGVQILLNDGKGRVITYDQLVIATGSHVNGGDLPLKLVGTADATIAALRTLQERIGAAKSIVIAGAGPTGVEVAGELASFYGRDKKLTLISSSEHVLTGSNVLPSLASSVEKDLKGLGVMILANARVAKTEMRDTAGGGTTTDISLSTGKILTADVYLPLFGLTVNTGFLPHHLLDESGNVKLDKNMRIKGTNNIWGIGDVGNLEPKQVTNTDAQIIYLAAALDQVLMGKVATTAGAPSKDYKPLDKTMIFLSLGPKHAAGQVGGWRLWAWMVNYVKGRSIFVDTAPDYVGGKKLRHASM